MELICQRDLRVELSKSEIKRIQGPWRLAKGMETWLPLPVNITHLVVAFYSCHEYDVNTDCYWITFLLKNEDWDIYSLDGGRFILTRPDEVQLWNLQTLMVNIFKPHTTILSVLPSPKNSVVLQLETGQVQMKAEGWGPINTETQDKLSALCVPCNPLCDCTLRWRRDPSRICIVTADGEETACLDLPETTLSWSWKHCDVGLVVRLDDTFYVCQQGEWTKFYTMKPGTCQDITDWWFQKGILCCTGIISRFINFRHKVEGEDDYANFPLEVQRILKCEVLEDSVVYYSADGCACEVGLTNIALNISTWWTLEPGDRVTTLIEGSSTTVALTRHGLCCVFDTALKQILKRPCRVGSFLMASLLEDNTFVVLDRQMLKIHIEEK